MNPAGLSRADLKNLLVGALSPIPILFDSQEPEKGVMTYVRISPVGMGDVYDMSDQRAFSTPRWQVDIYAYSISDSDVLRAGEAAEQALMAAQWRVRHPRPPLSFEGQLDAQKRRWFSWTFDAESLY